jgi:CRISPR-associated protein Cas1
MYGWRLGEVLPYADISVLRGTEGDRMKTMYRNLAVKYGIRWNGRRYDRNSPELSDLPNQAINHAATAVEGAAMIAVACTATIPQLGFIHEQSGNAFCLDIADLFRDEVTIPVAFAAVAEFQQKPDLDRNLEKMVRTFAGQAIQKKKIIPRMIDRIKELFDEHDSGGGY